jgi:hypothetical protein
MHADVAQLVEHHLAKVGVAGSNPVVRSTKPLVSGLLGIAVWASDGEMVPFGSPARALHGSPSRSWVSRPSRYMCSSLRAVSGGFGRS